MLRKQFDYFFIRFEMKWSLFISFFLLIMYSIITFSPMMIEVQRNVISLTTVITLLYAITISVFTTIIPVALSYRQVFIETRSNNSPVNKKTLGKSSMQDEFRHLLLDEKGFSLFKTFLEGEFSVENIKFIEDCSLMKTRIANMALNSRGSSDRGSAELLQIPANKEIEDKAKSIFDLYVAEGSILTINITWKTRQQLIDFFTSTSEENPRSLGDYHSIFNTANYEIIQLLQNDSFLRFKCNPLYREFKSMKKLATALTATGLDGEEAGASP